jgi:hypothetical protein
MLVRVVVLNKILRRQALVILVGHIFLLQPPQMLRLVQD